MVKVKQDQPRGATRATPTPWNISQMDHRDPFLSSSSSSISYWPNRRSSSIGTGGRGSSTSTAHGVISSVHTAWHSSAERKQMTKPKREGEKRSTAQWRARAPKSRFEVQGSSHLHGWTRAWTRFRSHSFPAAGHDVHVPDTEVIIPGLR